MEKITQPGAQRTTERTTQSDTERTHRENTRREHTRREHTPRENREKTQRKHSERHPTRLPRNRNQEDQDTPTTNQKHYRKTSKMTPRMTPK